MGDLIQFPVQRTRRLQAAVHATPVFCFDVRDPMSYLIADRVDRTLREVEWVVVDGTALIERSARTAPHRLRHDAEAHARALRLPLVWPDALADPSASCALRATAYACELGAGAPFALALSRLAFGGGFAPDDPETLTEAAAAAGIGLDGCLEAAGEAWRDEELRDGARRLRAEGVRSLPAFQLDGRWLEGEAGLRIAAAREGSGERLRRPLAPVG